MKGVSVINIIFFVGALIALICAAFMVANSENTEAKRAVEIADIAMKKTDAVSGDIIKSITEIKDLLANTDEEYKKLVASILESNAGADKLKQKIDWLEIKVNNAAQSNHAIQRIPPAIQKIVLTQEKPFQFRVIYKKVIAKPRPDGKDPTSQKTISDDRKAELMKSVQQKVKELSK